MSETASKKECRNIKLSAFVDEIFQDYDRNKDTKYVFFLGAGCSKSSGIPLAGELALEWFSELSKETHKYDDFIKKNKLKTLVKTAKKGTKKESELNKKLTALYFQLFETLFPDPISRQKEIQRLTEDKLPGLGYYRLAQLMQKSAFNIVISTNFDDLMQDALIYSGVKRARTISHHHLAHFIDRGDTPHIIKLHGDAHLHPFNDVDNTQQIESPLEKSVASLLNNTKLIVIGYGGGDKSIAGLLEESTGIAQVYWLNGTPPEKTKLNNWWDKLSFKTFVNEYDFDKIMDELGSKFELDEPDFKNFCKKLASQYEESFDKEIKEEKEEAIKDKDINELNKVVLKLYRLGKYTKGIEIAKEAVALTEKEHDTDHLDTANTYNNLGLLFKSMGKYEKALEYYKKDLAITKKVLGTDHPDTATTYNNLGALYEIMGEHEKALKYHKKALAITEKVLGTDHPETATTYNNLGTLYESMGEHEKALEYYKKDLAISEKVLGTDHPETATTYNNLGALYESMGKHEKALEYYKKALAIREKELGTDHPETATTYNNLGALYESMGEHEKALEYFLKALDILEKRLPEDHEYITSLRESINGLNSKE